MRKSTVLLLCLGVVASFAAQAEDKPVPAEVTSNARGIDGMIFIPSRLVRDPFITTSFNITPLYGGGTATGPGFNALGQTFGKRTLQLGELATGINASGALLPWLSLRLNIETTLFSGVNAPSALVAGISGIAGGGIGFTGSWAVTPNIRVGFLVDGHDRERIDVLPLGAVASSIQKGLVDLTGFSPITNIAEASAGGVVAFGVARSFAVDFTLEYTYQRIERRNSSTVDQANDMRAGAIVEFDLSQITPVPIGFVGSYRLDNAFESDGTSREHQFALGINYTGRPNLVLGIDLGGDFVTLRQILDTKAVVVAFVLTYFWA